MFDHPQVGQIVQVTTRYPEINYYAQNAWQLNHYQGVVGRADRSVPEGSFLLLTPQDPHMPTRVISLARVVAMHYADGSAIPVKSAATGVRVWQVQGSGNNVYTVTEERGQRRCTCPGFTFRKDCKHVH